MSSAFVQTLIGALAAIVGGLGAALWQTARADDVARSIRRAERHEQALIDFYALVTDIHGQLHALYRQAEHGQSAAQHNQARQALDKLAQYWNSRSSGVVSDHPVVTAYAYFNVSVQDGLPAIGTLQRVQELSAGDEAAGRRFLRDLGRVVGTLDDLRKTVREQVELLDSEPSQRRISLLLRKVRAPLPKRQRERLPGRLEVRAFLAVAVTTQELEVLSGGSAAEGNRDNVVILKVEGAAAVRALPAVTLEDRTPYFAGDGFTPSPWAYGPAFVDVEQHVRAVQLLPCPPLPVPDQR